MTDSYDLHAARASYTVALKSYEGMDDALETAKNKRGMCMKYLHTISPVAFGAAPYAALGSAGVAESYWSASIAIGELMLEKLRAFAGLHGIEMPGDMRKI